MSLTIHTKSQILYNSDIAISDVVEQIFPGPKAPFDRVQRCFTKEVFCAEGFYIAYA